MLVTWCSQILEIYWLATILSSTQAVFTFVLYFLILSGAYLSSIHKINGRFVFSLFYLFQGFFGYCQIVFLSVFILIIRILFCFSGLFRNDTDMVMMGVWDTDCPVDKNARFQVENTNTVLYCNFFLKYCSSVRKDNSQWTQREGMEYESKFKLIWTSLYPAF